MPKFYYQEQVVLPASAMDCVQAAGQTLTAMGGKPTVQGLRVIAKLGSQFKMRLVGGAFCPAKWLPIEIIVDVVDGGSQRQTVINVADRLGVGMMLGMEQKYRLHCQTTATYIRDGIAARLVARG